jgi:hypothetical protein
MIFEVFAAENIEVERMKSAAIHRIEGAQSPNGNPLAATVGGETAALGARSGRSACSIYASSVNSITGLENCFEAIGHARWHR